MSSTQGITTSRDASVARVDLKFEVAIIPVSDVDRSKEFYKRVGFRLDADDSPMDGLRIVQTTPPGSGTSVNFGLGITTAYTFGKALDYATDNGGLGIPIKFSMNRGRSTQDRTHMYVQSFIYDLPMGPGMRWLSSGLLAKFLGGWQFSGALSVYSGLPMTFTYNATGLNAPGNNQRANITGPTAVPGGIGPGSKWFDTSNFSIPAAATFGNAGRNTMSGPGYWNLDMSLIKRFLFTERFKSELRFETFNLTNTPHFNNPNSALDSTAFGTVTSSFGDRQVQLGFKLYF